MCGCRLRAQHCACLPFAKMCKGSAGRRPSCASRANLPALFFCPLQGAGSNPLYRLSAHDKATCALSFCPAVPGLLATSSTDKKVGRPQRNPAGAAAQHCGDRSALRAWAGLA